MKGSTDRAASRSNERGMALALALLALVLLGAVASGAFVVSRYNQGASANSAFATDAQNAAEAGLAAMYATWDPAVQDLLPIWDGTPATMSGTSPVQVGGNPLVVYVDSVKRLNTQLFLIEATGQRRDRSGNVVSQLKTAQIMRLTKPNIGINAAVTTQDPLTLNGNSYEINGYNILPPQWNAAECPALDPGNSDDVVGIRSSVSTGVKTQDWDNVFGFPSRDAPNDPTVTSATFQNFLNYSYSTLASMPGVKTISANQNLASVEPVAAGGICDQANAKNFGEPFRAPTAGVVPECYSYFPVVHAAGVLGDDLKFAGGGRGQGTLLIDGDLDIVGGFEWVGLIIARGKIKITGNGNKITGAILAEGANVTTAGSTAGDAEIHYSSCAIKAAVFGATFGKPLGQRGWLQTY
jgi:hypothetical protein